MTLQEKTKALKELRDIINTKQEELDKLIAPYVEQRDSLQAEILKDMKDSEQFSIRFDFATVTRAVRKTLKVIDESQVFEWLDENKLLNNYTQVKRVLLPQFDALAKQAVIDNKQIDGTEMRETEYLSLIKPSAKEDKRKIVTE